MPRAQRAVNRRWSTSKRVQKEEQEEEESEDYSEDGRDGVTGMQSKMKMTMAGKEWAEKMFCVLVFAQQKLRGEQEKRAGKGLVQVEESTESGKHKIEY
jgi:hypothetical protein